ncbi:MAG: TIGR02099 family protein [Proteobacteria bacterium]|nr:TIGR02099 family protein [Pseudomonadota bacterium]
MNPWRHRLRRARFALGALIAGLLIAMAVAMGLLQLLLPLVARHPDRLAQFLSVRLHRPVHFQSLQGQWQPSGPLLTVEGLTLGAAYRGGESLVLPKASIKFDLGAWLKPRHRWITLRLTGLELRVEHDAAGWRVLGLGNPNEKNQAPLQSLPVDLDLHALKVDIVDVVSQRTYAISSPHLRLVNVGDALHFGGSVVRRGAPQPITVIGDFDARHQNADLYIATHDLDLAAAMRDVDLRGYAARAGRGDLELWGSWRGNRLQDAAARFDLRALALAGPDGRRADLPALAGVVGIRRVADGYDVRYRSAGSAKDDIDDVGGASLHWQTGKGTPSLTLAARSIDLAPLLSLASLLPQAPASLSAWVANAHPGGRIDGAALRWNGDGRYALEARLRRIAATPYGNLPGVDLANATLRGDRESLALEIPQQPLTLFIPRAFRWPWAFQRAGGTVAAWHDAAGWHVGSDGFAFDNHDVGGECRGEVLIPADGGKPFLDVSAVVTHASVDATKFFLPLTLPPPTLAWLDRGLVAGEVDAGRVAFRGDLADWPFVNHHGRFEAVGHVHDAVLDYGPGWPRAEHIAASAEFIGNSAMVHADSAEVHGNEVTHAEASIPDFDDGVLTLTAQGEGSGASLLGFVRNSPIGHGLDSTLSALQIGGTGHLALTLVLPFARVEDFSLDGALQLHDADVTAKSWNLALQGVGGALSFDARGFRATALQGRWHDAPVALAIASGGDTGDAALQLQASMSGMFTPQSLLSDYPNLASLAKIAHGTGTFRIGLEVAAQGNAADAAKTLRVQSDLRGISVDLPAPLDKPPGSVLPMDLQLGMPFSGGDLRLTLGDLLRAHGRLPDADARKPPALAVAFGSAMPQAVPQQGMLVTGHAPVLDLGDWTQLAAGGPATGAAANAIGGLPPLVDAQVATDDALVFGSHLGALSLHYATQAGTRTITFDGAALAGTLALPDTDLAQRGITAQLQRLYWPESPPPQGQAQGQAVAPAPSAGALDLAPASLPPLHLAVDDLHLGKARMGAAHFESAPTAAGMHIARMDMKSRFADIRAQGDWNGNARDNRSRFSIQIASDNLGRMLEDLDYAGLISGGRATHASIDGSWPGAPSAFSLANIDGTLKVSVGEGRILDVRPGMGRLLGLFSITQLPRRLALDFGDVYKSGFGFNSVKGSFRLADGNAYTDDLDIDGASAEIKMRGRTGLRAHDYDQTVDVTPHTGGALAVVGAVVGGPIGAAAGLAISRAANQVAHARYSITGSWAKPVITTISRTVPEPAPSQPATAQSGATPAAATTSGG